MTIPAAVLRQAERSDEILSRLRQTVEATNTPPAATPPPTPEVVQAPAPAVPTASSPSTPEPGSVEQGAGKEGAQGRVDWKHKYLVLEGKYRAEVPAYAAEVRILKAKNNEVTAKLIEAQDELIRLKSGVTASGVVTDDALDPTLAAAIDARVQRATARLVGENTASNEKRDNEREQARTNQTVRERFENDVSDILRDSHGCDWREIDTLPAFGAYLREREPYTGQERQQLLTSAVNAADSVRAAIFFQDFLNKQRAALPAQPSAPPARDPREALVVPARSAAAAAVPVVVEKKFYTRGEITAHYSNYAKRQIDPRTPKSEMDRLNTIDMDIQAAMREGRIR